MLSKNYVKNCMEKGEVCPKLLDSYEDLKSVLAKLKELSYESIMNGDYEGGYDDDCEYEEVDYTDADYVNYVFDDVYIDSLIARDDCLKKIVRACDRGGGKNKLLVKLMLEADMELKKKNYLRAERDYGIYQNRV